MPPIAFRDYLQEVQEYMSLAPGTKAHRKVFHDLRQSLPDAETFDPQVKKWERIVCICLLASLIGFVSLIVLCIVTACRGQELFSPAQRKLGFVLLALFLIPEIPMLYANRRKERLVKAVIDREIRRFGEALNQLSDEQFSRVQALLNSDPEYFYGDEPPMPGDTCGCCECRHIFPADDADWYEDIPNCPHCDSCFLVYGTAELPVEEETLSLIHNLLFEEK